MAESSKIFTINKFCKVSFHLSKKQININLFVIKGCDVEVMLEKDFFETHKKFEFGDPKENSVKRSYLEEFVCYSA